MYEWEGVFMKRRFLGFIADFTAAALIVVTVWAVDYKMPRKGVSAVSLQETVKSREAGSGRPAEDTVDEGMWQSADYMLSDDSVQSAGSITSGELLQKIGNIASDELLQEIGNITSDKMSQAAGDKMDGSIQMADSMGNAQTVQEDTTQGHFSNALQYSDAQCAEGKNTGPMYAAQDWHIKFQDKFSDEIISGDTFYKSPNLSIELFYNHHDTGKLDESASGKYKKYGTQVSYVLADIYIGDITCLQTAFAQNTYGVGYTQKLSDMSETLQAVLAVNGDSYSNNRHKDNGTIIRNGVVYRNQPTDSETCVLNWDGTMDIYEPGQVDLNQLMERGAYQSWIFGPSLLDENGKAKESFWTWDYITYSHPRTAIGYFEPGHYGLLLVDGRQKDTRGMFLDEMAKVFENLGCKTAYNLDGGHCSFMTFQNQVANHPYKPEHEVTDGIFITEGL